MNKWTLRLALIGAASVSLAIGAGATSCAKAGNGDDSAAGIAPKAAHARATMLAWSIAPSGAVSLAPASKLNGPAGFGGTAEDAWTLRTAFDRDGRSGEPRESVVARGDDLEQSWTFDQKPRGSAAVSLRVHTEGVTFDHRDARGLHFRGKTAGTRYRYGRATWIDADGARTAIDARAEGDDIVLRVPRAVLEASRYPAVLDPLLGIDTALDAPVLGIAPSQLQSNPVAVAVDGATYLAWYDGRTGGITGTRLDPTTERPPAAQPYGVAVVGSRSPDTLLGTAGPPGLAWDGNATLLLAWTESDPTGQLRAFVERIDAQTGAVFAADGAGVQLDTTAPITDGSVPVVGWDGASFVVAWSGIDATTGVAEVEGTRVTASSAGRIVVAPATDVFCNQQAGGVPALLGCGTSTCLIVSEIMTGGSARPRVLDVTGAIVHQGRSLDACDAITAPWSQYLTAVQSLGGGAPAIASDGSNFVVSVGPTRVHADATVDPTLTAPAGESFVAGPGFDGTSFVFLTNEGFRSYAAATMVATDTPATTPAFDAEIVTFVAGTLFFAGENDGIVGAAYAATSKTILATAGGLESVGADSESSPVLVGGTSPALVWSDDGASKTLRATALDQESATAVGNDDQSTEQFAIAPRAIATDGTYAIFATNFIVASSGIGGTVASLGLSSFALRPLGDAGTTAGTDGGALGPFMGGVLSVSAPDDSDPSIALAYGGGTYLAVVSGMTNIEAIAFNLTDLSGGESSGTASVTVTDGSSTNLTTSRSSGVIDFDGTNFLVAWDDGRNGGDSIYATHVRPDATLVEADAYRISKSPFGQTEPQVAARTDKGGALVVWRDTRNEETIGDIYGHLVDATGAPVGDDIPIGLASGDQIVPVVVDAQDGLNFFVAWQDGRTQAAGDVYGTLVGYDGTVREPAGLPLATTGDAEKAPTVVTTSPGQMILAYVRHDSAFALGTDRIRTRTINTGKTSGSCTSDDDCTTLHCTDGVCCDVACHGACETCGGVGATSGKCTPVVDAVDSDTCSGSSICNGSAQCVEVRGQTCRLATDCASGFCVDGVCCDTACVGGCNACNASVATTGTCTILPQGSTGGSPSCLPESCDGTSAACPTGCKTDADCVRPYTCSGSGMCELLTGATCSSDARTLESTDGTTKSCAPYICEGSQCRTTCGSIEQCGDGFICDGSGFCVAPGTTDDGSGCSVSLACPDGGRGLGPITLGVAIAFGVSRRRKKRS